MHQHTALSLHGCDLHCAAPHSPAPHACPPPISPSIARIPRIPPGLATPAVRATEARHSTFRPPNPRALLALSLTLTAHTAVSTLGTHLQAAA